MSASAFLDVVFDGPPGPESGRFVEVEDEQGSGVNAGKWIQRDTGLWALRISRIAPELLDDIETFLDDQADGDIEGPNKALRLLSRLREARGKM